MNKTILFYSSVKSKKMFSIQQFYKTDICILRELGYNVKLSNSVVDYLLFWKYDIAFIYFYRYGLIPAMIARLFKKKVVFTGGIDYLDNNYAGIKSYLIQKLFFKLCILFSDKNILVSNADRKNILLFKKVLNPQKFPISFHVIDFERYVFNNLSKKEKILCTIAWMVREENVIRKGIDKAIYLFKKLYQYDKEYRMIIIGSLGAGSDLVQNIINKENLGKLITLTGSINEKDKINVLKKSMIYAQLSSYEGFGIAAIEALASGNIVVHTGKGGLKDGVGEHGILVKNLNYKEIVQRIQAVLLSTESHMELINDGIQHVKNNFKYEKRLKDFQEILNLLK